MHGKSRIGKVLLQNHKQCEHLIDYSSSSIVYFGRRPFIHAPPLELRLVFSLGVDGFNPSGMKIGKGSATSTGIYMVCLNFPVNLRYQPENMYLVGIMPRPNKPSLSQINHDLAPLINDLLLGWNPAFFFTRMYLYTSGRLC